MTWPLVGADVDTIAPTELWEDLNSDGDADTLVTMTDASGGFDLVGGPFDGGLSDRRVAFRAGLGVSLVAYIGSGDFDGDEQTDLVAMGGVIDPETATLEFYFDIYTGPFTIPGPPPLASARIVIPTDPHGTPFTPHVGDIDNDGFDDLSFGHWDVAYVVYGRGR